MRPRAAGASLIATSVRKPSPPRFTPRIGIPFAATRRATPSRVPSPPSTTIRSARSASSRRSTASAPIFFAVSVSASTALCLVRRMRVRVRATVIASGRSYLTTRPTVFMVRFATGFRHLSCAEIGGNAKAMDAHLVLSPKNFIRGAARGRIFFAVYDRYRIDVVARAGFAGLRSARQYDDRIRPRFTGLALHGGQHVGLAPINVSQSLDDCDLAKIPQRLMAQNRHVAIGRLGGAARRLHFRKPHLRRQRNDVSASRGGNRQSYDDRSSHE